MPALTKRSPCPCGSGKKYKHCHWDADHPQGDVPLESPVATEEPLVQEEGPRARWPLVVFALLVVALAVGFGWKTGSVGQGITVAVAGLLALGIFAVARDAPPPAPKPKTNYQRSGIAPLPPPEERRLQ